MSTAVSCSMFLASWVRAATVHSACRHFAIGHEGRSATGTGASGGGTTKRDQMSRMTIRLGLRLHLTAIDPRVNGVNYARAIFTMPQSITTTRRPAALICSSGSSRVGTRRWRTGRTLSWARVVSPGVVSHSGAFQPSPRLTSHRSDPRPRARRIPRAQGTASSRSFPIRTSRRSRSSSPAVAATRRPVEPAKTFVQAKAMFGPFPAR